MTKQHLGLALLEELGSEIYSKSQKIWKMDRPKRSKIIAIARLLNGVKLPVFEDACEKVSAKIDLLDDVPDIFKTLKPTRLVLQTDTPYLAAMFFVEEKIDPLYNNSGNTQKYSDRAFILIHATQLEDRNGVLTGNVSFIPDDRWRIDYQYLRKLHEYLKRQEEVDI